MKKGFTLVELSIVLVVVGLLIGGILVGQSLIDSARTQKFVRQMEQVYAAVSLFKDKFKQLPGDSKFNNPPGDGDGEIETIVTNTTDGDYGQESYDYEISAFWPHLQQNGFYKKEYPIFNNNATTGIKVGVHVPGTGYKSSNTEVTILPTHDERVILGANFEFFYQICAFDPAATNGGNNTNQRYSAFTPMEALAIDQKMDDGLTGRLLGFLTYQGNIVATNYMTDSGQGAAGDCWTISNIDNYNTTYKTKSCCLVIQMFPKR